MYMHAYARNLEELTERIGKQRVQAVGMAKAGWELVTIFSTN